MRSRCTYKLELHVLLLWDVRCIIRSKSSVGSFLPWNLSHGVSLSLEVLGVGGASCYQRAERAQKQNKENWQLWCRIFFFRFLSELHNSTSILSSKHFMYLFGGNSSATRIGVVLFFKYLTLLLSFPLNWNELIP